MANPNLVLPQNIATAQQLEEMKKAQMVAQANAIRAELYGHASNMYDQHIVHIFNDFSGDKEELEKRCHEFARACIKASKIFREEANADIRREGEFTKS